MLLNILNGVMLIGQIKNDNFLFQDLVSVYT